MTLPMRRAAAGLVLVGLLAACFGRLVLDPSALIVDADRPSVDPALIVDADRPSVDRARRVDDPSAGNDLTRLFLPHHLGIARQIARLGHLPMWDDRGFGGRPLIGNPQAGLFYPPVWLAWWTDAPSSLGWITFAHLLWSGLGAYRLARTLEMSFWGSLTSAGCVQISPYVLAQAFEGHCPHVWAASWYPWAVEAAIRLRRSLGPPSSPSPSAHHGRPALVLALILAATFLAGHPQEGYYLTIAVGAWAAFDGLVAIGSGRGRGAVGLWVVWAGILVLTVGLIAVELVPDAMAQGVGLRRPRLSIRAAGDYHLEPVNALQLLGPRALGGPSDYFGHENYWESVLSIGLVPLYLAAIGAAWSSDRRAIRGWLVLVVGAVVFASGRKLGLFAALFHILPGLDRFRVPARSLFLSSLGISMLAGLGVDALRAWASDDGRWRRLARRSGVAASTIALVVLAGGWASGRVDLAPRSGRVPELDRWLLGLSRLSQEPTLWIALGGLTIGVAWGVKHPGHRRRVASLLGLLGLVELGLYGHDLLRASPAERFLGADPIGRALLEGRSEGLEPPRIRVVDTLYGDLQAGRLGLSKTNVNDSFQLRHAADLYETLYHVFTPERDDRGAPMDRAVAAYRQEIRQAVLDRMGVGLLVADRVVPGSSWEPVASGSAGRSPFVVLRNPTAMPRAYVVPRAEVAADDSSTVARFREGDPRESVLMPADPLGPCSGPRQAFTPAVWTSTDPDRVVLEVTTEAPGLLVIADTWMPGWSAEVDGRYAPIFRGNRAQRVVPLARPGPHEIVLTYRTPGLRAGLAISSASVVIVVFLLATGYLRHLSLTRPLPPG
jgi:hypothetical protein